MSPKLAEEIRDSILAATQRLDASIQTVYDRWPNGQAALYKRLAGTVMGLLFTNILTPIYRSHPDLEPEALRQARLTGGSRTSMPIELARELSLLTREAFEEISALASRIRESESESESDQESVAEAFDEVLVALRDMETFLARSSEG